MKIKIEINEINFSNKEVVLLLAICPARSTLICLYYDQDYNKGILLQHVNIYVPKTSLGS